MSRLQPTLREAEAHVASMLRWITAAKEVRPFGCVEAIKATRWQCAEREQPDGFWIRWKGHRGWIVIHWPVSRIDRRCDDCGGILLDRRDCGGDGFNYDPRWLTGNPSKCDPTREGWVKGRWVCLACFNRVRPALKRAQEINEARLMIGRIQREVRHAA
jgi:hypothetical protein